MAVRKISPGSAKKSVHGILWPEPENAYGNVVYKYASSDEIDAMNQANDGNFILNVDKYDQPKDVYVTPDDPLSSVTGAEENYQIGSLNPNGATASPSYIIAGDASGIDFSSQGNVPGGSGTQWITSEQRR